ncbi:ASTRA-associated 1 [Hyphodiscus hymeniophilus]|uniref:ASTRA-associated protein 1 n=1 Tax=Hyphodiscus hymeniophilus TaxID=353542 RepID=A0A9P6VS08_9HELO|nr:ASTRA-associated 1 [Hyphodiscus hymeniophilus]
MSLPPAQPAYILRGHPAQVHSAEFIRSNSRLVTGDADGWIIIWSLDIKRPTAVWKAHEGAILGVRDWGERIITHGKDNKLIVWKLSEDDEASMSVVLPVDTPPEPRKQPWVLHILHVNTMNFCSFAQTSLHSSSASASEEDELLIAVPNTMSSETVDIFHLPLSKRLHTVPGNGTIKGGMVMAVSIFHHPLTIQLTVIAGYESGHTIVSRLSPSHGWQCIYTAQPHSQPILSLDVSVSNGFYLTSSADAIIAKHPIPVIVETLRPAIETLPLKTQQTKHSGQQSLRIRSDGRIFATAGWDSKVRVYATKSMKELAVLKWHKEGCYCLAFAHVKEDSSEGQEKADSSTDLVKRPKEMTVKQERLWKAKTMHWLAVGSKDAKVSLWDIY